MTPKLAGLIASFLLTVSATMTSANELNGAQGDPDVLGSVTAYQRLTDQDMAAIHGAAGIRHRLRVSLTRSVIQRSYSYVGGNAIRQAFNIHAQVMGRR